eukprot:COSAG05_NODE_1684_length_4282_cov_3.736314_2_plen_348_part_00
MLSPRGFFAPPPLRDIPGIARTSSLSRSLSRVFSNEGHPTAHAQWDELDINTPLGQAFGDDELIYGDDLALSPLTSMETSEASLHRAGGTAQKWALDRSMSTELPGGSPGFPPPIQSPYLSLRGGALQKLPDNGPVPMVSNDKLTFCIDQLEGCSITETSAADLCTLLDAPPIAAARSTDDSDGPDDGSTGGAGSNSKHDGSDSEHEGPSIWERAFNTAAQVVKPVVGKMHQQVVKNANSGTARGPVAKVAKKHKKRRIVLKDPNKPKPKPWSETELAYFRQLLAEEGPNNWASKARKLGTNRTAKSLHTRWLRDEGRIIDRPRGMAAMREAALAQQRAEQEAAAAQ